MDNNKIKPNNYSPIVIGRVGKGMSFKVVTPYKNVIGREEALYAEDFITRRTTQALNTISKKLEVTSMKTIDKQAILDILNSLEVIKQKRISIIK